MHSDIVLSVVCVCAVQSHGPHVGGHTLEDGASCFAFYLGNHYISKNQPEIRQKAEL